MRHKKSFNHLGRKSAHRNAMLSNMASSLMMHKRIKTTVAKAKALRTFVEPLITRSKEDTTHNRRVVFSYLQNKESVSELFRDIATKVASREGGYTRVLKTGTRAGDNADMCIIELVDYNETYVTTKDSKTKSTRRRRGGKKKAEGEVSDAEATVVDQSVEEVTEVKVEEEVKAETEVKVEEPKAEEKVVEAKAEEKVEEKKEEKKEEAKEEKKEDKKDEETKE